MLAKLHVSFKTKVSLLPWKGQAGIAGRVCEDSAIHRFPRTVNPLLKGHVHSFTVHASQSKCCIFCQDMVYRLCKQYDHVIMLSKNQSAHSPGSHLINLGANSCKLINHGIKPSGQQ